MDLFVDSEIELPTIYIESNSFMPPEGLQNTKEKLHNERLYFMEITVMADSNIRSLRSKPISGVSLITNPLLPPYIHNVLFAPP